MRNNSNKNNPKTAARIPAVRQGAAAKPTSLAERREKAVVRLPEERRKGTKYQVIRGQYLRRQTNQNETTDNTKVTAMQNASAKQEEKREKAKRQTTVADTVKNEKSKTVLPSAKNASYESNDNNTVSETDVKSEAKEKYAKSEKAAAFTERLQTNIELSKAASNGALAAQDNYPSSLQKDTVNYNQKLDSNGSDYIPPNVTWDNVLDRSVQKDSVYSQDGSAAERAASYKEKADFYLKKMKKDADTGKKEVNPYNVTWDNVLDRSVQKDSVYSQGGSAAERAASYKEKADFYLKKMKKDADTGKKEVNPYQDKEIGALYKNAYKLAYKEELAGTKSDTLFDKAQSALQLKSEVDNALNKDNTGEAVAVAAAIPLTHAAAKAVRKLANKNKAVNAGKAGFELAAKVTADTAAADSVGEATVNVAAAVPKYFVEKKVEKTVRQVVQQQHDRKIEAQKERLREKQEKVEKRAQQMKKENMQRSMKADLYKSEHGMGAKGNALQRIKSAIKNTIESMKRAVSFVKSSGMMLMAVGGSSLIVILAAALVLLIIILFVLFPFFYISKDGEDGKNKIESSPFKDTIQHYYEVMDTVVEDFNENVIQALLDSRGKHDNTGVVNPEKYAQYESDYQSYQEQNDAYLYGDFDVYIDTYNTSDPPAEPEENYWYTEEELSAGGMERGPIFEGFVWDDETDGQAVPKGKLYDEMLCTISTFNAKIMTRPDTFTEAPPDTEDTNISDTETGIDDNSESESTSNVGGDIIYMTDETVAGAYEGAEFWEFTNWEEGVNCPNGGDCCSKTVKSTITVTDDDGNEHTEIVTEEETYCPGHYVIKMKLKFDFDLDKVWEKYQFDGEDEKNYKQVKKEFGKEKVKAGIT